MKIRISFLLLLSLFVCSCEQRSFEDQQLAVLLSQNGKILTENYSNGVAESDLTNIQSLTKSIISILIGIAIEQDFIKSLDEPIARFFPQEFATKTDARKLKITIRHLLNQTSGLAWKGYLEHEAFKNSENPIQFVLSKGMEAEPGSSYNYNSGGTHLLSVILSRATGQTTLAFALQHLFMPIGINNLKWGKLGNEFYDGAGFSLEMHPKDLLKIGQLLLNKGVFEGQQIISEATLQYLFDPAQKSKTFWGIKKSTHGACWYQSEIDGHKVNYAMGYGGQFILLFPEKNLVIVAMHNAETEDGIPQQNWFLKHQLPALLENK